MVKKIKNINQLKKILEDFQEVGWYEYKKKKLFVGNSSKNKNEVQRNRYKRLREKGICIHCGHRKATIGRLCKTCKPIRDR